MTYTPADGSIIVTPPSVAVLLGALASVSTPNASHPVERSPTILGISADGRLISQRQRPVDSWNIPTARRRGSGSCPSLAAAFAPWTIKNRDAFGRFPQNHVIELPSHKHYCFMPNPDQTARVLTRSSTVSSHRNRAVRAIETMRCGR